MDWLIGLDYSFATTLRIGYLQSQSVPTIFWRHIPWNYREPELPQWMPNCEMFGAHCFDAVISKECFKQCQTNCIEDC